MSAAGAGSVLGGAGEISYRVVRPPRARRIRVRVDPDRGVEVVLPPRAPERAAAAAVAELAEWIEQRLAEFARARARLAGERGSVPYLDGRLTLVPEAGRTRAHRARRDAARAERRRRGSGDRALVPARGARGPRPTSAV